MYTALYYWANSVVILVWFQQYGRFFFDDLIGSEMDFQTDLRLQFWPKWVIWLCVWREERARKIQIVCLTSYIYFVTPCACARGKVISLVVVVVVIIVVVVINKNIAKSGDLGT